jgi:hypothetical protein
MKKGIHLRINVRKKNFSAALKDDRGKKLDAFYFSDNSNGILEPIK